MRDVNRVGSIVSNVSFKRSSSIAGPGVQLDKLQPKTTQSIEKLNMNDSNF